MLAMGRSRFVFGSRWAKVLLQGKIFNAAARAGKHAAYDNRPEKADFSRHFPQPHA
jgi:hypothetical protein